MAAPSLTKIVAFAAFLAHVSAEPGSHMRVDPVTVIPRIVRSGALEGLASAEPSDHIVWDFATETAIIAPSASDASVLERSSGPLKGAVREGKISHESVLAAATICIAGAACDLAINQLQWQSMQQLVGLQAASASHHALELTRAIRTQKLQQWNAFREITKEKAASLSQLQLQHIPWEGMWRSSMSQLQAIGEPIKQKAAMVSRGVAPLPKHTNPDEVEPPKRTRLASSTAVAVVLALVAFLRRSSATATEKVFGTTSSRTSVAATQVLFVPVQSSAPFFPGRSQAAHTASTSASSRKSPRQDKSLGRAGITEGWPGIIALAEHVQQLLKMSALSGKATTVTSKDGQQHLRNVLVMPAFAAPLKLLSSRLGSSRESTREPDSLETPRGLTRESADGLAPYRCRARSL